MVNDKRVGIALSGGGYRAAGFHIGTLKKLHQLGILNRADVLSTISGGSITGACYCLHQGDFSEFEDRMLKALSTKSVISYVLCSWTFLRSAIPSLISLILSFTLPFTRWAPFTLVPIVILVFFIIRYQFRIFPLSVIIEKAYNSFFFGDATLSKLCDSPELAIGSTNLQTQRHFTFSKRKMEDSAYAYFPRPILFNGGDFPLARAVMASSCVPFAFSPISIDSIYFRDPAQASEVAPKLVDGGVYDNQGIHKITQNNSSYACDIIIVSDAGNHLPFEKSYNNTFTLLLRTVNTFMARIKNFQMMQNLYQPNSKREIAYQSLGWDLGNCLPGFFDNLCAGNIAECVISEHQLPPGWVSSPVEHRDQIISYLAQRVKLTEILDRSIPEERLQKIRQIGTNLTTIKSNLIKDMIIHAENLTELQVRLYCPYLFINQ